MHQSQSLGLRGPLLVMVSIKIFQLQNYSAIYRPLSSASENTMDLLFHFERPLNMVSQWEPEAINLGFSFSAIVAVLRHLINQTCYLCVLSV